MRVRGTGRLINRQRFGRPRSTTQREDRYFVNMALRQRRVTARQLRDQLRATSA